MIGILSKELFKIPHLKLLLQQEVQLIAKTYNSTNITAIAGWGKRKPALKAMQYARQHKLPYLALEDGFLRSVGLGKTSPPLSIVIDPEGIYYDATSKSKLETLIPQPLTPEQNKRAKALLISWQQARVSKYNHLREYTGTLPENYVLVVDQTVGDASIKYGMATVDNFQSMLTAALADNPDATIVIKTHPDVVAGYKQGYFSLATLANEARIKIFAEAVHPVRLIAEAKSVYVVTSQMGFEALLWHKPVYTFGMPFYAGWGLTTDNLTAPKRRQNLLSKTDIINLEQLVYASLIAYPKYVNPETAELCTVEETLDYLAWQRQQRELYPAIIYGLNFSRWKQAIVRQFFQGSKVKFVTKIKSIPKQQTVIIWGSREINPDILRNKKLKILRLEDGFLRSVGLGADLIKPLSWVIDDLGIYYNAQQISALENYLQTADFSTAILQRAQKLRTNLVKHKLTKYNVTAVPKNVATDFPSTELLQAQEQGQNIILVAGQVETDASIRFATTNIKTNIGLLTAVKQANPKAYIIYKPHPDVVSGLRKSGQGEIETKHVCTEVITHVAMGKILDIVDEVHVLTSLTGFEALLRNKRVTCYGSPFYSGWGLTHDLQTLNRRSRSLNLDELIAGTLILYPRYISRTTGNFTTPEQVLTELLAWRTAENHTISSWRKLFRLWLGLLAK